MQANFWKIVPFQVTPDSPARATLRTNKERFKSASHKVTHLNTRI
jgi:hypothetical protein